MHSNTTGTTELQRQSAAYASVRQRLFRPANAVKPAAPVVIKRVERKQDHHVVNWKARKAEWYAAQAASSGSPCQRYIRGRCDAVGFSYEEVIGPSREREVTDFRQKLMHEIKTQVKPDISFVALGKLFGGRDHTTVIHACQKFGYETAPSRRITKAQIRKMKSLHEAGATKADIAKVIDCAPDSVRRYLDEDYIMRRKAADTAKRAARKVKERRQAAKARAAEG